MKELRAEQVEASNRWIKFWRTVIAVAFILAIGSAIFGTFDPNQAPSISSVMKSNDLAVTVQSIIKSKHAQR